ncbi:MAG: 4-hydroxy-tetrahydrodipicolinate reductase, partial [Verrucomicrobiota bacterium]
MPGVVVCGAMGRMGRAILSALAENPHGLTLSSAVETAGHPLMGTDVSAAAGSARGAVRLSDNFAGAIARAEVAIDFTTPESSVRHAEACAAAGKPVVIGSTG